MTDLIIIVALIVILGLSGTYIYKAKKSGKKCIGCPNSCSCAEKSCSCKDKQ